MNPEFYDKVIIPDDVSDGIKLKEDEVNAKYVTTDKTLECQLFSTQRMS